MSKLFKRQNDDLASLDGRRFSLDKLMIVFSFVILIIIAIIPVVMIVYNALFVNGKLDLGSFRTVLLHPDNLGAMWNTINIAFWVTLFGTIIGLFYAWLLGRSDIPLKGFMRALFNIPYMFP
ncbi:MAG TPA: iron ABC transporter permease, partial [Erysipelothrix sp.]|nr:iron ABC transporter permease [Erysipelothrix sp.]